MGDETLTGFGSDDFWEKRRGRHQMITDAVSKFLEDRPELVFRPDTMPQGLVPEETAQPGPSGSNILGLLDFQKNYLAQSQPMVYDPETDTMVPYVNPNAY